MYWTLYIQSIAKAASSKCGLPRAQCFLTPESILYLYKSTIWPCMEYCSHICSDAPMSHRLDLPGQVQKWVVSLVGPGFSSDLQTLSHRRDITMGNVPLSLRISYLPNMSLVEPLACHTVNSPMCRTKFYQSSFFPRTVTLWNSLSNECFPPDYNLTAFK